MRGLCAAKGCCAELFIVPSCLPGAFNAGSSSDSAAQYFFLRARGVYLATSL
jgi:hypothetical protein